MHRIFNWRCTKMHRKTFYSFWKRFCYQVAFSSDFNNSITSRIINLKHVQFSFKNAIIFKCNWQVEWKRSRMQILPKFSLKKWQVINKVLVTSMCRNIESLQRMDRTCKRLPELMKFLEIFRKYPHWKYIRSSALKHIRCIELIPREAKLTRLITAEKNRRWEKNAFLYLLACLTHYLLRYMVFTKLIVYFLGLFSVELPFSFLLILRLFNWLLSFSCFRMNLFQHFLYASFFSTWISNGAQTEVGRSAFHIKTPQIWIISETPVFYRF